MILSLVSSTQLARWRIACMVVSCTVSAIALSEVNRVERGQLFLLSLPGENAASEVEIVDAHQSAASYKYPAVGAVLAIGIIVAWSGPMAFLSRCRHRSVPILAIFGVAVVADMLTTVIFFHTRGVFYELHPGVRLFGYAYGRTTGAVLAKLVQFVGVLTIAFLSGRYGQWIIIVATFCTLRLPRIISSSLVSD